MEIMDALALEAAVAARPCRISAEVRGRLLICGIGKAPGGDVAARPRAAGLPRSEPSHRRASRGQGRRARAHAI